jgi:hypothetical protein
MVFFCTVRAMEEGADGKQRWFARARIYKPFKKPRNRFPAWRICPTTSLDAPASQATQAGGIDFFESIPGLLKRLQIRPQESK